ncbi:hypothetical protein LWM68_46645 [Niabella sp. W65]|nr:hypothetical protein [Niabella sp. W65]MCH7369552.1 hypothetical protein [Niabella sp. W65]ULT45093.1 hypothetical protein KRR40_18415 [Niabella sp. I65]
MSSYFVEDGSYLKLRNIELGYTLPKKISGRARIQHLRIYTSARNILTIKKTSLPASIRRCRVMDT